MKYRVTLAVAALAAAALLFLQAEVRRAATTFTRVPTIGERLTCPLDRFTDELRNARKNVSERLQLLVHFSEKPGYDVATFFQENGITLYPETWIYDYAVAETTLEHVCFLSELPGITSIDIAE